MGGKARWVGPLSPRSLLVALLGSVAAVVIGVFTNLIAAHWSWAVLAGLVALAVVSAACAAWTSEAGRKDATAELGTSPQPPDRTVRARGTGLMPPIGSRVFTGRADELARLTNALPHASRAGPALIVITGMPGVGKTELAIRTVREVNDQYSDGVFWVSLRTYAARESQVDTTEALRLLLNTVDVAPDERADTARLSQQWREVTAGRQLMMVLDDADASGQVLPLLPTAPGSAVIVTSRHVLVGLDPDESISLDVLSMPESLALADAIFTRASSPDSGKTAAIAERYRLPLAIRQVSDLMVSDPALS